MGGEVMPVTKAGTDPDGKFVLWVTGPEKATARSVEILNEDPNLRLATGGLIPRQGPYVF